MTEARLWAVLGTVAPEEPRVPTTLPQWRPVLTGEGPEGEVYELGGDEACTMGELAEIVTDLSGTDVVCRNLLV